MSGILWVLGALAVALTVGGYGVWTILNCSDKKDEALRKEREKALHEKAQELQQQFDSIDRMRRNGF